jgi:protein TonB
MPQELLRDVLRTGDVSGRARRRLSVLPVSIAVHAVVLLIFLSYPFLSPGELPAIAAPLPPVPIMTTAVPPPPPPSSSPSAPRESAAAPRSAPETITLESEPPTPPGGVDGGNPTSPSVTTGTGLLSDLNVSAPPPAPPVPPPPAIQKPLHIGGAIREPKKIVHVPPEYPEAAQRARIEGVVILEATLDVNGSVSAVRVLSSQPLLVDAAVRAVKQWRYTPTLLNGVPVPVLMTVRVNFTLR